MITSEQVRNIVSRAISGTSMFIVDVSVGVGNRILVEIDSPTGVSINDCLAVSRAVEGSFDREKEDFALEVASPGLDKPLRIPQQYVKNMGREAKVVTKDGKEAKGVITAADERGFEITEEKKIKLEGKKKKELVKEVHRFGFDDIKSTIIIISFK